MGDRFYQQQLKAIGNCPGATKAQQRRKRNVAWTDELKAQVIEMYQKAEPTPETSIEIVKEIAEEVEQTPNGVRLILSKAGVYVKKTPASGTKSGSGGNGGGTRIGKEEAQAGLKAAISDAGQEVDEDIISKLTGKAAIYLTKVISAINE